MWHAKNAVVAPCTAFKAGAGIRVATLENTVLSDAVFYVLTPGDDMRLVRIPSFRPGTHSAEAWTLAPFTSTVIRRAINRRYAAALASIFSFTSVWKKPRGFTSMLVVDAQPLLSNVSPHDSARFFGTAIRRSLPD